jgi:hypothetical protein
MTVGDRFCAGDATTPAKIMSAEMMIDGAGILFVIICSGRYEFCGAQ